MKKLRISRTLAVLLALSSTLVTGVSASHAAGSDASYAKALTLNGDAWKYDSKNDVYYQIGISYVSKPADKAYESVAIYVPGKYVTAKATSGGEYSIKVNDASKIGQYSAATAPYAFPVNTPGYAAAPAVTSYSYTSEISSFIKAGFIYVQAGLRGRNSTTSSYSDGAPWGVTDAKAAIRFIRYNASSLPGNTSEFFVYGMSGGGAQSSIIGASGDSALYTKYLDSIGAAGYDHNGNALSDAVQGVMAWCPITSLDQADEAYEWNMGQFFSSGTRASGTWTAALSKDLAASYSNFINSLGLKDSQGNTLKLSSSSTGIYQAGSYYSYVLSVVQQSLNNFLKDTKFPYTPSSGGFGGTPPAGGFKPNGTPPSGGAGFGAPPAGSSGGSTTSTTYKTVASYIASLNKSGTWVTYDAKSNTAKITSLADFVRNLKSASKVVGAFDTPDKSAGENNVFGDGQSTSSHFDATEAALIASNAKKYSALSGWSASYATAYAKDLAASDSLGSTTQTRLDMYNPMYYLSSYYKGYKTSKVAPLWRIRTGIDQSDTANTTEINLALALSNYSSSEKVDFATVWGQAHTMAERTGEPIANFISWVESATK